jgi:hypothetical protein
MLTRNFSYTKKEPNRDAVVFYIFCEGKWREPHYFNFFASIDSRIRFEVIPAGQHDRNSPDGLFEKAASFILKSENNPTPKYEVNEADQVWFVIDTDDWKDKIPALKESCSKYKNWFVAQSNPSFEIWLYYHFHEIKPQLDEVAQANGMKAYLGGKIRGGFDTRKHPAFIKTAAFHSEKNFQEENGQPQIFCTNLHGLANRILPLIQEELNIVLARIDKE